MYKHVSPLVLDSSYTTYFDVSVDMVRIKTGKLKGILMTEIQDMESEKPKILERYTESQGLTATQMHLQAFGINSFVPHLFFTYLELANVTLY